MRPPLFVRSPTDNERKLLRGFMRLSHDPFVVRRCEILLSSAHGERASSIAKRLGCDHQTVLNALHAFNARGLAAVRRGRPARHRKG